jgi:hypothetical protein
VLYNTLDNVLKKLRAEIGAKMVPVSVDANQEDVYKAVLSRVYERLWNEFDWPHLRVEIDVSIPSATQYIELTANPASATTLDFQRVNQAWIRKAAVAAPDEAYWYPMDYGIGPGHYNVRSTAGDFRSLNWQQYVDPLDPNTQKFELWPVLTFDASQRMDVRFYGIKQLTEPNLENAGDVLELDDNMVVLYAAAELLRRKNADDADYKLAQAQQLYSKLKGQQNKSEPFILGGGRHPGAFADRRTRTAGRFQWSPKAY